ncbi:MAG: hydroxyacid dehydrogenase [Clostridia bacterium]|nr:hydroxyacid dehydrogenase [Clostridia bacterium]
MKKVVILESLGIPEAELAELERRFEGEIQFESFGRTTDAEQLVEECRGADAAILANMPFPDPVIARCDSLRFIDVAFTGVDHVGLNAAREKGIRVSNASGYSNEAVAELVIGMALSMLRHIPEVQTKVRNGGTKDGLVGTELCGKTVGIIGFGRIGRRTGELFHAFGCRVLGTCRTVHTDFPAYAEQVSMDDLLRNSDIVVLQCPLHEGTRGMIDYEKLSMMKKSAILINTARGPVTNEDDLARALHEGLIAGAAADVFTREPPLPPDTQMLHAPNTLLTPHIAFATAESMSQRAHIVFDNLRAWLDGAPVNVIL